MRQGEVRKRLDMPAGVLFPVLVLSGNATPTTRRAKAGSYSARGAWRLSDDYATVHRVPFAGDDGTDAMGLAVPEMVFWLPVSALSEPIGNAWDMRPILSTVHALFT